MRYRAFISYCTVDAAWARWLLRRLENYRVPPRLVGTTGTHGLIGARLGAFFRDRDELPSAADLGATLRGIIAESEALIVICSTAAAQSRWVNAEIEAFRASHGDDRILCLIASGEPGSSDPALECFPPALMGQCADGARSEPLAADARREGDGRDRAFLKIVAGLLGVGLDTLVQRDAQRRHRRMAAMVAASVLGMLVTSGLAITAVLAQGDAERRQAQAEDLLGFMLGNLREKLTTVGRLDLMRVVDDKATTYFASLDARDLSDRALAEQGRSLIGIGQVRWNEGNHVEAMAAFTQAHERALALRARQPADGQRLYDLAQAQYWVGQTAWRQNRFDIAGDWLRRYRDSTQELAAMDRGKFDWQREAAYGQHNLAVLDESQGRYVDAERAFLAERESYAKWRAAHPADTLLRHEAADVESWLGALSLRSGRLGEAQRYFAAAESALSGNRQSEPDNIKWRLEALLQQIYLAEALALGGDTAGARRWIDSANTAAAQLVRHDPGNAAWAVAAATCKWWRARLGMAGAAEATLLEATEAQAMLAKVHAAEPRDSRVLSWLARTQLLLAELALASGDDDSARTWLDFARGVLEPGWADRPSEILRVSLANLEILDGSLRHRLGDLRTAQARWRRAEAILLEGDSAAAPPFMRLEPLVRTQRLLGDEERAKVHLQRMTAAGYTPLRPWPRHSTASLIAEANDR